MKIDGACHCGDIRYEAEVDPAAVAICHCTDCQTLSGSAFRTVVPARRSDFRLLAGQPKAYLKTALPPRTQRWSRSAQGWLTSLGTMKRFEKSA